MAWLQSLDVSLFRFINVTLSNPVFDVVMPFFSGNRLFFPAAFLLMAWLLWKGGLRGRIFAGVLLLIVLCGDMFLIGMLKQVIGRPRPFQSIPDVHLLVGRGRSGSMPSSHTSSWFAATLITFVYYRWSWRLMLPVAAMVGLSRICVGVHYPSDVLAGAILGAGYAAAGLWILNALWQAVGPAWFPAWWRRMPSLLEPGVQAPEPTEPAVARAEADRQWLRLGYVILFALLVARLGYQASGVIELSKDEAYQWLWSKHLALSYYSKPPLIAYTHFLGTSLWGDTAFGVRFFPPVIATVLGLLLLRFLSATVSVRAGFWVILIVNCTPLMAIGATLMTIDPLLVLFWTAAMIAGWRAVQPDGRTGHWLWAGLWMGLGFLSKYSAAYQVLCWAIFFALWRPARVHLRRPGPWLALLLLLLATLPVVIWNAQNQWITVAHVSHNAALDRAWTPTLRFFWDFVFAETFLLHPVFFVAMVWAMAAFWKRDRKNPLAFYLFAMGAPVFLGHALYSFHSRILPNWIAPAVLPMACLMALYWDKRWDSARRRLRPWLQGGLILGYAVVILCLDSDLIGKIVGRPLPAPVDPLRRVRGWEAAAKVVEGERQRLQAEGRPVFIVADHYGVTSLLSFYIAESRTNVRTRPFVYAKTEPQPKNQFYFWPGYAGRRRGENAIYVREAENPELVPGWFWPWVRGERDLIRPHPPEPSVPPDPIGDEFESVVELGVFDLKYKGRTLRRLQLFACRNLR